MARFLACFALLAVVGSLLAMEVVSFSVSTSLPALRHACKNAFVSKPPLPSAQNRARHRQAVMASGGEEEDSVTLPPMPKFFSKWDDPNYDPTKDVVDTDVPLQIAAFEGDVGAIRSALLS